MIYLIGGSPRSGKTTLAKALAEKRGIPYVSADHLGSAIFPYISESEYATKLPLRVARKETNYSNDLFYSKYSIEQIVDFYWRQAETQWLGLKSFINYILEDEHDFIVEGWQLLPHLVHTIITPENKKAIQASFLYKDDVDDILKGIKASTIKNDWVIKNTKDEDTFLAIAKMISLFGNRVKREANKYSLPTNDTDFDFMQKLDSLLESFD